MRRVDIHFNWARKHLNVLCIMTGGLLLFLLTLFLPPVADDWAYMASPKIQEFPLSRYRRLFDVLIGMFLQSHPGFFPHLNRVLIVISHTVCALLLYKISVEFLKVKPKISLFFAMAFLVGGNTITTVINYDCLNQTGSLMFGALGIYFFLKADTTLKKFAAYFTFCILALCTKESGIVYFAIIPLFGVIRDMTDGTFTVKSGLKKLAAFYIPGFVCALAYYFSPIIQSERLYVYGTGINTVRNYLIGICMRMVFAYSQSDLVSLMAFRGTVSAVAFFKVFVTTLLSMPLLIVSFITIMNLLKNRDIRFFVVLLLVITSIIVFTPTLLAIPTGSIWSYNCIVFFANLAFSFILNTVKRNTVIAGIAAFTLASAITAGNIYYQDIQTAKRQAEAMNRIRAVLTKKDIKNYAVYNLNSQRGKKGGVYPVVLYTMQQIFDLGGSGLYAVFGYGAKLTAVHLCNEEFEFRGNRGREPTYIDVSDEDLLAYTQEEAQKAVRSGAYDVALVLLPNDEFFLYQ